MLRTSAPIRRPPPGVFSTCFSGSRVMSIIFRRPLDIHLHQVDQIGAAGDEFRVRVASDLAYRVDDIVGARVLEIDHDRPITCWIAATMLV